MLSAERCGMTARTLLAARKDSPKKRRKERGLDEASRQNWWLGLVSSRDAIRIAPDRAGKSVAEPYSFQEPQQ